MFRGSGHLAARACCRLGISANAISYTSFAIAAVAGISFKLAADHLWLLLLAPLLCYFRLYLNMLDGMVALESGKRSLRGEIVNEVPDRFSDILIFLGVAHCGLARVELGYGAALAALLVAYIGILGPMVGAQRQFGGLMSKPWRMAALHIGAWAEFSMQSFAGEPSLWYGLSLLDWSLIVILAGAAQTIVTRLARIMASIRQDPSTD